MEQYISKSAVMAEIERIKKEECPTDSYEGRCKLLWFEQFLSFLSTLEVKEVDLEKEVANWWNAHYSSKAYTFEGYSGHYMENSTVVSLAQYFYELGLKAQKGE